MSETHSTITITYSLAIDPRTHLEAWLEDAEPKPDTNVHNTTLVYWCP